MTDDDPQHKRKATGFAALGDLSFNNLPESEAVGDRPKTGSVPNVSKNQPQKDNRSQQAETPSGPPHKTPRPIPYQGKQAATGGTGKGGILWGAAALGIIWIVYASNLSPTLPPQVAASKPIEVVPPIGNGLALSQDQIRYCLSESIRIDGARGALNTTSQFDIDRFNGMIANYNSRCANYSYRQGSMDGVRAAVEADRRRLSFEGAARFPR